MVVTANTLALCASLASLVIALPLRPSDYLAKVQLNMEDPTLHRKKQIKRENVNSFGVATWSEYDADTESGDESDDDSDFDIDNPGAPHSSVRSTMETSADDAFHGIVVLEATVAAAARPRVITVGRATSQGRRVTIPAGGVAQTRTMKLDDTGRIPQQIGCWPKREARIWSSL